MKLERDTTRPGRKQQHAAVAALALIVSNAPALAWRGPAASLDHATAALYQRHGLRHQDGFSSSSGYSSVYVRGNLIAYPRGLMITIAKTLLERPETEGAPAPPTIDRPRQAAERLAACWSPPLPPQGATVEITIRLGFNNRGEIMAPPRITYVKAPHGTSVEDVRASIYAAIKACTPLRFSAAMANGMPGNPVAVQFVGRRNEYEK